MSSYKTYAPCTEASETFCYKKCIMQDGSSVVPPNPVERMLVLRVGVRHSGENLGIMVLGLI